MYGERSTVWSSHWATMPRPNRRLTALAQEVVRCAAPLLPAGRGLLLSLEVDTAQMLRLTWWSSEDLSLVAEISAQPEGFCGAGTEEGALQEAAVELLDYLAGRWPNPPAELGVITDGSGVAFAPESPSPSASGWLARQAAGAAPLVAIVPLDPAGPCALLSRIEDTASLH